MSGPPAIFENRVEEEMEPIIEQVKRCDGRGAEMTVEVRLLYASAFMFIAAQNIVTQHPWDQGFRIAALLALIGAMWTRRGAGRKRS